MDISKSDGLLILSKFVLGVVFISRKKDSSFLLLSGKTLASNIDRDGQFVELGLLDDARSIQHHVTSAVVLGEGYTVADAVEAGKEAHEA